MFYPVVNHGVKRKGSPTRNPRTEPNLILEVVPEEQRSDNGGGDEEADIHHGLQLLHMQMENIEFPDDESAPHRA